MTPAHGRPQVVDALGHGARLVCFPHAGGSETAFRTWQGLLPDTIEVVAARYPGRPGRSGEASPASFRHLVARMVDDVVHLRDRPLALFGHSMGATVAYEAAVVLEQRFGIPIQHVFVSGRAAPDRVQPSQLHTARDEVLIAAVRLLDDRHGALLDEPELRELFLPVLRADLRLVERHHGTPTSEAVTAPITAFAGVDDPACGPADAREWRRFTRGRFTLRTFPGGHFYFEDHSAEVMTAIAEALTNPGGLPTPRQAQDPGPGSPARPASRLS